MGTDIGSWAERRNEKGEWEPIEDLHPFDWRDYGIFGFLANCMNISEVPPIAVPRGLPEDSSPSIKACYEDPEDKFFGASWLTVEELRAFDYDREFEDRRGARRLPNGIMSYGATCEPGEGRRATFREFLGTAFFHDLKSLEAAKAERVIFYFDR